MKKSGYDIFLTILLAILTVGIVVTAGYLVYKYYQKYKINADADTFLNEFDEAIDNKIKDQGNDLYTNEQEEQAEEDQEEEDEKGVRGIISDSLTYKGYSVAGKLEMPTVNLQYPVLDQMTDANAIEVSVAIQYGVGLNNIGNTVIIGHNYRNGLFFGSNKNLYVGDTIYITDWATGNRRQYVIYNKYTTEESDTSYFQRDTSGKREVSLVTCQTDNSYRLVIWAREV